MSEKPFVRLAWGHWEACIESARRNIEAMMTPAIDYCHKCQRQMEFRAGKYHCLVCGVEFTKSEAKRIATLNEEVTECEKASKPEGD